FRLSHPVTQLLPDLKPILLSLSLCSVIFGAVVDVDKFARNRDKIRLCIQGIIIIKGFNWGWFYPRPLLRC
ncbi:hypothetical protein HAX54_006627, partial [Datura stramonium]|nr:hypothetical protein [Datura stramonium]